MRKILHLSYHFLFLFFLFTLTSCAKSTSFVSDIQNSIDTGIQIPKKITVPIYVKKFYDNANKIKCSNLKEEDFIITKSNFNPGFFTGALWLDIYVPNTTAALGPSYAI